jgi:hypothetical protein
VAHDLATAAPRGGYAMDGRPENPRVLPATQDQAIVHPASQDAANPLLALPEPHGP